MHLKPDPDAVEFLRRSDCCLSLLFSVHFISWDMPPFGLAQGESIPQNISVMTNQKMTSEG